MKKCAMCQHWNRKIVVVRDGAVMDSPLGGCDAPAILRGYGVREDEVPINGALVEDDEGWGILTGPYFGCVLHKDRA